MAGSLESIACQRHPASLFPTCLLMTRAPTSGKMFVRARMNVSHHVAWRRGACSSSGHRTFAIGSSTDRRPTHHLNQPGSSGSSAPSFINARAHQLCIPIFASNSLRRHNHSPAWAPAVASRKIAGRRCASTAHARRPDPTAPEEELLEDSITLPEPAPEYDTPRKLHRLLDSYVIAQTKAKKVATPARSS